MTDTSTMDANTQLSVTGIAKSPEASVAKGKINPSSIDADTQRDFRALAAAVLSKSVDSEGNPVNFDIDSIQTRETYNLKFLKDQGKCRDIVKQYVRARNANWDNLDKREVERVDKFVRDIPSLSRKLDLPPLTTIPDLRVVEGRESGAQIKKSLSSIDVVKGANGVDSVGQVSSKYLPIYDQLSERIPEAAAIIQPAANRLAEARAKYDAAKEDYEKAVADFNQGSKSFQAYQQAKVKYYFDGLAKIEGTDRIKVKVQEGEGAQKTTKEVILKDHIEDLRAKVEKGEVKLSDALNSIERLSQRAMDNFFVSYLPKPEERVKAWFNLAKNKDLKATSEAHKRFDREIVELQKNEPGKTNMPDRSILDAKKQAYETAVSELNFATQRLTDVDAQLDQASERNFVLRYALDPKNKGNKEGVTTVPTERLAEYHYQTRVHFFNQFNKDAASLNAEID
ncbi:MAG: hypothetical protein GYA55_09575, partial [SAR324 cluster bacterium]|nr:hypothetical protein [SAR324 cluster bacterium]